GAMTWRGPPPSRPGWWAPSTASPQPPPTGGGGRAPSPCWPSAPPRSSPSSGSGAPPPHPLLPSAWGGAATGAAPTPVWGLAAMAMFGVFLFLTYYLQQTLHYSALKAGVAFLPVAAGIAVATGGVVGRFLPRVGPRPLTVTGLAVAMGSFLWLSRIDV